MRNPVVRAFLWCSMAALALLHGCAAPERPKPGVQAHRLVLEEGYVLDYQIDTRISQIDGASCYVFVSGTLANPTARKLLRQSKLDFAFYDEGGHLLFRDISHPRMDVFPGSQVQFDLVESPVFRKHCPKFDRVEARLSRLY